MTDTVAANLRALRGEEGETRKSIIDRLAERGTMMHPTTLKRLEEATQPAKIDELVALADVYDVSLEYLVSSRRPEAEAEKVMRDAAAIGHRIDALLRDLIGVGEKLDAIDQSRCPLDGEYELLSAAEEAIARGVVMLTTGITPTAEFNAKAKFAEEGMSDEGYAAADAERLDLTGKVKEHLAGLRDGSR